MSNSTYKRRNDDDKRDNYDDFLREEGNKRLKELQTYSEGDKSKQYNNRDNYRRDGGGNRDNRDNRDNNYNKREGGREGGGNNRYNNKKNKNDSFDYSNYKFGKKENEEDNKPKGPKEKPDFKPSGSLKNDSSSNYGIDKKELGGEQEGIKFKWSEPAEARLPIDKWVLYPFKEKEALEAIHLHRKKSFLFGRNREIADIPIDHPSCSSQHAVLVFRNIKKENLDTGSIKSLILPYIIDLESTNGTFYNGKKVEPTRYLELRSKDIIKFGTSTREYVLLCEDSIEESSSDSDN